MFSITPFSALRYVVRIKGGATAMTWEPCRVVAIDASSDEPKYIVEVRDASGDLYLEKVDLIRKSAPTA